MDCEALGRFSGVSCCSTHEESLRVVKHEGCFFDFDNHVITTASCRSKSCHGMDSLSSERGQYETRYQ